MDPNALRDAYRTLLDAAATVADAAADPPPAEWTAEQILAHVSIVTAGTVATVADVASGAPTTYDNRTALDAWTIDRVVARAGGRAGLPERIRHQADALCAVVGPALSAAELATPVSTLLLSNGALLVDQPLPLRDLLTGLADVELPGHTAQLLALLPATAA